MKKIIYLCVFILLLFSCEVDHLETIPEKYREAFLYYSYEEDEEFYFLKNNTDTVKFVAEFINITIHWYDPWTTFKIKASYEVFELHMNNGHSFFSAADGGHIKFLKNYFTDIENFYDSLKVNDKYYYNVYEIIGGDDLTHTRIFTTKDEGILFVDNGVDEYVLLDKP